MGELADLRGMDLVRWLVALVPGLLIIMLVSKVLLSAANVTSHCARVPAFINSLDLSNLGVDFRRQYMVTYVINSDAGYFISEAKVTGAVVIKLAYVVCVAALTALTRIASGK